MNEINQLKKLMEAVDSTENETETVEENETVEEDRQTLGSNRLPYDIEFDNEDITIFTLGGKPVLEMSLDDWMALISKFNRVFRGKEGPR